MYRILNLALKDIQQVLRDKKSLIFLLAMPLVFTFLMGLAFRPPAPEDQTLKIGWIHTTDGEAAALLSRSLTSTGQIQTQPLDSADLEAAARLVEDGKLDAVLALPADFDRNMQLDQPAPLTLIVSPASARGQAAQAAVESALARSQSTLKTTALSLKAVGNLDEPLRTTVLQQAEQAWQTPALAVQRETVGDEPVVQNAYQQTSPGMIVQFTLFGLITAANVLVLERRNQTLQRMLTTSLRRWQVLCGHLLSIFLVAFFQQILLLAAGQLLFGVNYLAQPAAILLVAAGLALWAAALGLLIGVSARGEEQVILFAMLAMFLFTALGGAWFPLEGSGAAFVAVGRLTPAYWAMTGFQNIIQRGLGFSSALKPLAILLAYSAGFLALAVLQFRRKEVR